MEQLAQLHITRTDSSYQFRLDLPEGPAGQEYHTELTPETRERLRRALQAVTQAVPHMALTELKRQAAKLGAVNDALLSLGRTLFDTMLPDPLREEICRLDAPLLIHTNTPDIPWELLYDSRLKQRDRYLCLVNSVGRFIYHDKMRDQPTTFLDRAKRKFPKKDSQSLSILFLVNPTSERTSAEEEVVSLCTSLPETVSRTILYRQQANQLEMRLHTNTEPPHVLHYAGPAPVFNGHNESTLLLAGNSRLGAGCHVGCDFLFGLVGGRLFPPVLGPRG